MAYGAEHDRIRAILPDGFTSIRPVLRINAEIRDEKFDSHLPKRKYCDETKHFIAVFFIFF